MNRQDPGGLGASATCCYLGGRAVGTPRGASASASCCYLNSGAVRAPREASASASCCYPRPVVGRGASPTSPSKIVDRCAPYGARNDPSSSWGPDKGSAHPGSPSASCCYPNDPARGAGRGRTAGASCCYPGSAAARDTDVMTSGKIVDVCAPRSVHERPLSRPTLPGSSASCCYHWRVAAV